ncbi:glutathione peroxidase, partial [Lachnospiraceae bacterium]|nr:glutathione peroxidase [Lachnospiraceae bacterium]
LEEVMAAVANARGVGKRTLDNIRDRVEQLFRKEGANE